MTKRFLKISIVIIFSLALSVILCYFLVYLSLSSCAKSIKHFDDWCNTQDGFEYYYNKNTKQGAYILKIPNEEELTIPEYVDGKRVTRLGHCDIGIGYKNDYIINGNNTKKLTIQHEFEVPNNYGSLFYANFPNLTDLVFIDFIYCNLSNTKNELTVPYYIGNCNYKKPNVELRKSKRKYESDGFIPKIIVIPEYVKIIEKDVFAGLTGVTIKTSFTSIPEGWQDGWNGDCTVEYGVKI